MSGNRDNNWSSQKNRRTSSYKKQLDKIFDPDAEVPEGFEDVVETIAPEEGTEEFEKKKAIEKLREANGFREFIEAVNSYRETELPLPDNENLLLRMLDHPDETIVQDVLEHVLDLNERRELKRTAPLRNRLSTIRSMASRDRTRELADRIEEMLDSL